MASSLLLFLAGGDLQNTQKCNKQVCFSPDLFSDFSLFRSVNLLLSSFRLDVLFFFRWADLEMGVVVRSEGKKEMAHAAEEGDRGSVGVVAGEGLLLTG